MKTADNDNSNFQINMSEKYLFADDIFCNHASNCHVLGLPMENLRDGREVELIKSILIVKWPNFNDSHI